RHNSLPTYSPPPGGPTSDKSSWPRSGRTCNGLRAVVVAEAATAAGALAAVDDLELLEPAARADRHTRQRRSAQATRQVRLVPEPLVETREQRTAAGQHDATVHDVGGKLGRRLVERLLERVDDLAGRLLERVPDLLRRDYHRLREPGEEVSPPDLS